MQAFEYAEFEIPVSKFFKIIHRYTERIMLRVVGDYEAIKDGVRCGDFYLTEDAYQTDAEAERLLKYYADVPVWNVHVVWGEDYWPVKFRNHKGQSIYAGICGNVYYKDVREGLLREKEDRRKEKQREYRQRKKKEKKDANT